MPSLGRRTLITSTLFKKLNLDYEKEKEFLDGLIKDFVSLLGKFEECKKEESVDPQVAAEKEKFESDFVALNCEIQQIRSDNETLLDELRIRDEHIKKIDKDIQEKASLIRILEDSINDMSKKK